MGREECPGQKNWHKQTPEARDSLSPSSWPGSCSRSWRQNWGEGQGMFIQPNGNGCSEGKHGGSGHRGSEATGTRARGVGRREKFGWSRFMLKVGKG